MFGKVGRVGYPMTWRRVLSRNGLEDGDYGTVPRNWFSAGPVTVADKAFFETGGQDPADWYRTAIADRNRDREQVLARLKLLAGDLRRLEADSLDERYQVDRIHRVTGVDKDDIAAVLRAFMEE